MILNKTLHSINIPKYWGLSKNHSSEIKKMVESFYKSIQSFYGKESLTNVLKKIQEKCKNVLLLSIETPALTSIKLDYLVTIEVSNYHAQPFLTKDNQNLDKRLNKFLLFLLLLFILMF